MHKIISTLFIISTLLLSACTKIPDIEEVKKIDDPFLESITNNTPEEDIPDDEVEDEPEEVIEDKISKLTPKSTLKNGLYTWKIGDTLKISIFGEPELTETVEVISDGTVTYLYPVGTITAKGLTIKELQAEITTKLKTVYKTPLVSVLPVELIKPTLSELELLQKRQIRLISILGSVTKPGKYKINKGDRILDVIALAGGLKTQNKNLLVTNIVDSSGSYPNLAKAYLARKNRLVKVSFKKLILDNNIKHNVRVHNGDYIYIPDSRSRRVFVIGEVNFQRAIPIENNISAAKAIALSGGFTLNADRRQVHIIRGSLRNPLHYVCDLKKLFWGKGSRDIKLQADDIVYIPEKGLSKASRSATQIMPFLRNLLDSLDLKSGFQEKF